ncbi:MAG: helix-turn-helix transcriptional regulator, partial [Actinomycetota bacterium]
MRAVEFERSSPVSRWLIEDRPSHILGIVCLRWGELSEARRLLSGLLDEAKDVGDELSTTVLLADLGDLEWRSGRPARSLSYAEESCRLAEQTNTFADLSLLALGRATIGEIDEARELAGRQMRTCEQRGDILWGMLPALQALTYVELVAGDAPAAAVHGLRLWRAIDDFGIAEPGLYPQLSGAAEALVATGRRGEAEPIVAWMERRGEALGRASALAAGHRCRGLVHAAAGDIESATRALAVSVDAYKEAGSLFEAARTLLHDGTVRRRARQKADARRSLDEAREIFDSLGATAWVAKTVAELNRGGGRAPAPAGGLTPTELRIAELVAEGAANREIAEQLFISLRTVEANLTRIYRKLHMSSRRDLARYVRDSGPGAEDGSDLESPAVSSTE